MTSLNYGKVKVGNNHIHIQGKHATYVAKADFSDFYWILKKEKAIEF